MFDDLLASLCVICLLFFHWLIEGFAVSLYYYGRRREWNKLKWLWMRLFLRCWMETNHLFKLGWANRSAEMMIKLWVCVAIISNADGIYQRASFVSVALRIHFLSYASSRNSNVNNWLKKKRNEFTSISWPARTHRFKDRDSLANDAESGNEITHFCWNKVKIGTQHAATHHNNTL